MWKNLPARVLRDDGDWIKVLVLTTIPYVVFARRNEFTSLEEE